MADVTSGTISIAAPVSEVRELLFDIAKYPTWSAAIKSVEVLQKDSSDRVLSARLAVDAGMMKDRVVLDYDWSQAPDRLSFSLSDADLLTAMDGVYLITGDDENTKVTYELNVEISMPLPSIMRHKAEQAVIDSALAQLKSFVEKEK
jgi:ribosome-associated toxin RatA of RatAB toxin-antitoxin module